LAIIIAIMEAGEIVQIGNPEEILVNPKTEYVANFVEHADPTGVITARTVALPFNGRHFEPSGEEEGLSFWHRKGYPEIRFGVDKDGKLSRMTFEGNDVSIYDLETRINEGGQRPGTSYRCRGLLRGEHDPEAGHERARLF